MHLYIYICVAKCMYGYVGIMAKYMLQHMLTGTYNKNSET